MLNQLISFCLWGIGCTFASLFLAAESQPTGPTGTGQGDSGTELTISVQNLALEPVRNAKVELLNWSSQWESTRWVGMTNADGEVTFNDVRLDYGAAVVQHPDYATVMHSLSIEPSATDQPQRHRLVAKLGKATQSHVQIVDAEKMPISGAEIGFLLVTNAELNLSMALTIEDLQRFGAGDFSSDSAGRLALPPLPSGSVVQLQVYHNRLAPAVIDQFEISQDSTPTLVMTPGSELQVEAAGNAVEAGELEGVRLNMRLFTREGGVQNRLMHSLKIVDGKFQIGLHKRHYNSLILQADDYFITPRFDSGIHPLVDLNVGEDQTNWRINIRRKFPVRGRLVDSSGNPVPNVSLFIDGSNDVYNETSQSWAPHAERPWASIDFVTTNADGSFETKLPTGQTLFTTYSGACFFEDDNGLIVDYQGGDQLADLVVQRLPEIHLVVKDEMGTPIPRAIVRIMGNPHTKYHCADQTGQVRLTLTDRPRDESQENPSHFLDLLAFDPYSHLAGTCRLDLRDTQGCENAQLVVQPQELEWVHRSLQARDRRFKQWLDREPQETNEWLKKSPLAAAGTVVDTMSAGIWSGTDAHSLDRFRGKHVLLDFWFIGCGPCHRELPNVQLAHELYREHGFSVVSVHNSNMSADQVQQYAAAAGMNYPLVVDPPDAPILSKYAAHGVSSYPTYILLDTDGSISSHSSTSSDPNLRLFLLESIRLVVLRNSD